MYHLLTGLYNRYSEKPKFNILVLGIESSGKTSWLDKVRSHISRTSSRPLQKITPTVGQNVVNLSLPSYILHCWDLGGQESLRSMWKRYLDDAELLVWAMDSRDWLSIAEVPQPTAQEKAFQEQSGQEVIQTNEEESSKRRNESWSVLESLAQNRRTASLPLLIIMTKVDTLSPSQIEHFRLSIHDIIERKLLELSSKSNGAIGTNNEAVNQWSDWHTIVCSAATGEGLNEFIEWLHTRAKQKKIEYN